MENCSRLCRPKLGAELPDPTDGHVHTIKNGTIKTSRLPLLGVLCHLGKRSSRLSTSNKQMTSTSL